MTSHHEEMRSTHDPFLSVRDKREIFAVLIQRQLARILRLVDLEVDGAAVKADSFVITGPAPIEGYATTLPDSRPLRYESIESYAYSEGRLGMIKRDLERVLGYGYFMQGREVLKVNGFRL